MNREERPKPQRALAVQGTYSAQKNLHKEKVMKSQGTGTVRFVSHQEVLLDHRIWELISAIKTLLCPKCGHTIGLHYKEGGCESLVDNVNYCECLFGNLPHQMRCCLELAERVQDVLWHLKREGNNSANVGQR